MKKTDNIEVTSFKDAIYISTKYEKYRTSIIGEAVYILGEGEKIEDQFTTTEKDFLLPLVNLCDELIESKIIPEPGPGAFTKAIFDANCHAKIIEWCNAFGLPFPTSQAAAVRCRTTNTTYPAFSVEDFIVNAFRVHSMFYKWQKGIKTDTYLFDCNGCVLYSLSQKNGKPAMTLIFPDAFSVARVQLALTALNPTTAYKFVMQCKMCGKWFFGRKNARYCEDPCKRQDFYKQKKKETGVKA